MGVRMSGFFLAFSIWLKWDTSVSSLFLDQKFQCADMKRRNVEESIVRVTFHRGVSFFVRGSNYAPGWLQRVGENNYLNVWWWHRSVVPATDFKWSQGARVTSFKPVNAALWSLTEDILINHVQDHDALCVKGWGETHLSWKKQGRGSKALACYQRGCPYHTIMWNGLCGGSCTLSIFIVFWWGQLFIFSFQTLCLL